MARSQFTLFVVAFLAFSTSSALQVTPNSQCASVCIDEADQDRSDPNVSNTVGSDVVCRDLNYATPVGQKYKKCVECLQNSADKSQTESDLQWFLYNLRFSINSCVFGLANASDPLSSPCSIQSSCGPLVGALQDGMDQPLNSNRYSYCTAYGNSFTGPRFGPCARCLRLSEEQNYMANFFIALKAGCDQQPEVGKIIGLDGSLFTKIPVNSTSVAEAPSTTPGNQNKSGLTTGAYAGIGVAGAFVILVFIAACVIGRRKHKALKDRERLSSGLNDRFGSSMITTPVHGAYGDPNPPKPTAYQSVGLVNVPSKGEKGLGLQQYDHQAHEAYMTTPHYPRPTSMLSHHTIPTRGVIPTPYSKYVPSRNHSPNPSFSPAGSTQPSDTPSHSPNSIVDTSSPGNGSSAQETSNLTRHTGPPIIGVGLPRGNGLPRSNSRRRTRDLSLGRDDDRSTISGPIVTVNTRDDEEEEAIKRRERERLYRLGFKSKNDREKNSPAKAKEMWPGNY